MITIILIKTAASKQDAEKEFNRVISNFQGIARKPSSIAIEAGYRHQEIPFRGKLPNLPNGTYLMHFAIFNDRRTIVHDEEIEVQVENGKFQILFGSHKPFGDRMKFDTPYVISVNANGKRSDRMPFTDAWVTITVTYNDEGLDDEMSLELRESICSAFRSKGYITI